MTETFYIEDVSGANIYFRIFGLTGAEAGQVFDFDDNTFKALSGAVTPYVAATERADMSGTGRSGYTAAIDLATINLTGTAKRYLLQAYNNVAPANGDNPISDGTAFVVQFGDTGDGPLDVDFDGAFTTTAGVAVRFIVGLTKRGLPVDLNAVDAAAEVVITAREHGAGVDLFVTAGDTVNAAGRFEVTELTPGYTDDRVYLHTIEITENGNTHTFHKLLPVHG